MLERRDNVVKTHWGWARESERMPYERDMLWKKLPEGSVYFFDADGWHRMDGKIQELIPIVGDLPHG